MIALALAAAVTVHSWPKEHRADFSNGFGDDVIVSFPGDSTLLAFGSRAEWIAWEVDRYVYFRTLMPYTLMPYYRLPAETREP